MQKIVDEILMLLQIPGSHYFTAVTAEGNYIKIRVSDHSANSRNNGNHRTLSFISKRTPEQRLGWRMSAEWMILENGSTNTDEEIADILAENEIVNIFK